MDLNCVPLQELVQAIRDREGVASIVAYVDLKEATTSNTQPWNVAISRSSLPLAVGLKVIIDKQIDSMVEDSTVSQFDGEEEAETCGED